MSKCEKCIHYEVCNGALLYPKAELNCEHYKDKSLVVELPCKVGDVIYLPWKFQGVKSIALLTVKHIIFNSEGKYVKTDFNTDDEAYYDKYQCGRYGFEDFGKMVFLTKEEAEAKQKEIEGK